MLRHLIGAYYSRYADMGPRLTALLGLRGLPALAEQVRAIRNWRRQVLGAVIAAAREEDLLAASEATALALAFTVTSHAHWQVLVGEGHREDPSTVTAGPVQGDPARRQLTRRGSASGPHDAAT